MQKWRGMHKGLPDAPKRSRYRVRKGWHRVLFENSAKHPRNNCSKDSPKSGKTYRYVEDAEDSPSRIPFREVGAQHHYRTGWFQKFLLSRVGRSWDSVYSEIRQGLDYRNGAQAETLEHILWHVETKCWIGVDGEIYSGGRCRPWPVFNTFFVHPDTGTLEYSDDTFGRKQKRLTVKKEYEKNFRSAKISDPSDERNCLEKDHNGIWFAFRTEERVEIVKHTHGGGTFEIVRHEMRQMQISKRELARCGLTNGFPELENKPSEFADN